MITKEEALELLHSTETYKIERTVSTSDMNKFQEAICAFSNDLPNSRNKGYLILRAHEVPPTNNRQRHTFKRQASFERAIGGNSPL